MNKPATSFGRQNYGILQLGILLALMESYRMGKSYAALEYTFRPIWLEDPEYNWTVSPDESRWKTYKEGAENMGLLFAGTAEFPWVVDLRIEKKLEEYWAIGNLVTHHAIFTTCRVVLDVEKNLTGSVAHALFGELYMFAYAERSHDDKWRFGGRRYIHRAEKHPRCNIQDENYYDGGIVLVSSPILPAPPTISTADFHIDMATGFLVEDDLSKMIMQRTVCYIASIGREFSNIKNHLVQDYKVKYRVYWEEPEQCVEHVDHMCPNRQIGTWGCTRDIKNVNKKGKELMCFKSRAKVGAVCDHDRGAPLVCDGTIHGLVVLGAKKDYCNNLLPLPFWVQKLHVFNSFFEAVEEEEEDERSISKIRRAGVRSLASTIFTVKHDRVFSMSSIIFIGWLQSLVFL